MIGILIPTIILILLLGIILIILQRTFHFVGRMDGWSIGIYVGDSPYSFRPIVNGSNPVLTGKDITDAPIEFVADPFMIKNNLRWYMFFEALNRDTRKGDIGLAVSDDGFRWSYQKIVLSEPFHLSYPYIFEYNKDFYMIPEAYQSKSIRLYKAISFPGQWKFEMNLLTGVDYVDSSIFFYNNIWWLFSSPTIKGDVLKLFYANELKGPWIEHPANPIVVAKPNLARCGGRVLVFNNKVIRYSQGEYCINGNYVNAYEITKLSPTGYEEIEYSANPILKCSGIGWNSDEMHTIDPHYLGNGQWIACVDGNRRFIGMRKWLKR